MCVGYATEAAVGEVKPRLPQEVVLHHEVYAVPEGEAQRRSAYDGLMGQFSTRNEMGADTWTKRVIGRMGKLAALSGRDKLVTTLHAMGFELK